MVVIAGLLTLLLQQPPTFRTGVEVVAVDVHVVDKQGNPIENIRADEFEVSIGGRSRRVASVELIRYTAGQRDTARSLSAESAPPTSPGVRPRRMYIVAVDEHSLQPASAFAAVEAGSRFIDSLQPDDLVAVFAYPTGRAKSDLTTDHALVKRTLAGVAGLRDEPTSRFHLSPSEAIDIANRDMDVIRAVMARECRGGDIGCSSTLIQGEATSLVGAFEMTVSQSIGGLRGLVRSLAPIPGRKTLVMVSGGLMTTDRSIGRVNPKAEISQLAREASAANLAVFALHLDWSFLEAFSPKGKLRPSMFRDANMSAAGLETLAGAAGGSVMRVYGTSPEVALQRVLRETSAHYLLAVEVESTDRDGQSRPIRVRVNRRGATVRSRSEVVIPRR